MAGARSGPTGRMLHSHWLDWLDRRQHTFQSLLGASFQEFMAPLHPQPRSPRSDQRTARRRSVCRPVIRPPPFQRWRLSAALGTSIACANRYWLIPNGRKNSPQQQPPGVNEHASKLIVNRFFDISGRLPSSESRAGNWSLDADAVHGHGGLPRSRLQAGCPGWNLQDRLEACGRHQEWESCAKESLREGHGEAIAPKARHRLSETRPWVVSANERT